MKQITTITAIFLVNGLCLSSAAADKPIPFAGGLNQGGNEEKKAFGAPNKVSEEGQSEEKQGRIGNRQPNPHLGRGGEESKPGTGGGQKPQGPNDKKELTRPAVVPKGGPLYNDPEVAEAIGLTEQQAEELRKVHEFAIKRCGEVMSNEKLTEEQKQREIDGIKLTQKGRRAEILTAEQLAALEKLHKGAKEYKEQQAGKKGKESSGKPKKTKAHFSQLIRRNSQDSKGAGRGVSVASVLGPDKEKEIIEINKRCRRQMVEAVQSCNGQILALETSTKAAKLAHEASTKAAKLAHEASTEASILAIKESLRLAIFAIKENPELEAEDKKKQIAQVEYEAKLKKAEIESEAKAKHAEIVEEAKAKHAELVAEKKQHFATAETEREAALGQQLSAEEYEAYKEIRVNNSTLRQQRTVKKEEKPKQKGEQGGTNSKGRPEKGSNDSKGRPEKGGTDSKGRPEKGGGSEQATKFPPHWGEPPATQTKDLVQLPGNFGEGSSTLFRWIEEHMDEDAKKRQEQVILYTARGCGYCIKAANLLRSKGIDFVKKDIGANRQAYEEVAQKIKKAGIKWSGGVPVTDARGKIVVGYNEPALNSIQKRP